MSSSRRKIVTEEPANEGAESPREERGREKPEYFGWVYHLGVNSIGHEFCHLRFLLIRGKYVEVYKRDPHENHGIKPIRKGIVGPTFMVEELGRRKFNHGDLYVLRFYNRLDETKKGQIACATAGEARTWMEAFDYAKQQAEYELSRSKSVREKLNMEAEINLEVHRPRVRRYALGLRKLIKIGQGPEKLLRQSSKVGVGVRSNGLSKGDGGDAIEAHEWKCVQTINGIRLFEDVSETKGTKCALVKAVGVIDAGADIVFDVILDLEKQRRYEWDMLTGDLELLDSYDGHYDVVYATCDPKYLTGWHSKKDFVFSRQWFCGQDGTYTILQLPAYQKKRPQRSGYLRTKINPSTWEIRNLEVCASGARCLVTHMLEIPSEGWCRWKKNNYSKFEKTIPFALLCQVAGLKEYIKANPVLKWDSSATVIDSKHPEYPVSGEMEDGDVHEEFYDAMGAGTSSSSDDDDDESDDDEEKVDDGKQDHKVRLKNVSWAITSLALKRESGTRDADKELDGTVPAITLDSRYRGTVKEARDETEDNCWSCPSGTGFMIRGKNYLRDSSKIRGGDPLLKLVAVDWFKLDKCSSDQVSLHPNCLPQSDAGRKLPFLLVVNLQVPAKPNYSVVLYYASDRPVRKGSSLARFVDGNDLYRDSRFKLIPSIVEGYWMVKRAVGTKACLLGKAVTCRYFRQDNFLEIDVDISSSSVARSVIGLVLGYVSSIVVDLAIVIEAKEEADLPEFVLGTARLKRIRLDSAVLL